MQLAIWTFDDGRSLAVWTTGRGLGIKDQVTLMLQLVTHLKQKVANEQLTVQQSLYCFIDFRK